jgi:hypothetical protein
MNERLVRLETHFEYIQRDLAEIKTSLARLNDLPTKSDLNSWRWQWIATAIAIIALTVGGVVGGLTLINRSADSKPIVIQMPAPTGPTKQP